MTQRLMELGDESSKERFGRKRYEQDGRIETDSLRITSQQISAAIQLVPGVDLTAGAAAIR